jgi:hypothetical protein
MQLAASVSGCQLITKSVCVSQELSRSHEKFSGVYVRTSYCVI